jgi:quinol monooxygenase YgiN
MPTIIAGNGVVTQINVFTTTPDRQQALIDLLIEAATASKETPGWISASLHRSLDGTRVVNYAQCADMASWQAVMERLKAGNFFERNKVLGTAAPGLYDVVFTLER